MRVGIVGAGQLARLLILEGSRIGISFTVLSDSPHSSSSELAPQVVGSFDDKDLLQTFSKDVEVVTAEFEHVPIDAYRTMEEIKPCFPSSKALLACQDRLIEKNLFSSLDIPTTKFLPVASKTDLKKAITFPLILKRCKFGYDGKGQWKIESFEQGAEILDSMPGEQCIAESIVSFDREVSIIGVFGRNGERAFYPLIETRHNDGILDSAISPAPNISTELSDLATSYITRVAEELSYVGVLTLELFQVGDQLLANELAPRVHNSGHWTLNGSITSQFENHIRAICGLPLGSTNSLGVSAMKNIIGTFPDKSTLLADEALHLYDYGKEPRPGRKIGHMTYLASNEANALEKLSCDSWK